MTKPEIIYNPATIAECGGPCEQGPEYCDCGELRIDSSPTNYSEPTTNWRTTMTEHPLTDDFCHRISETFPPDAAERNNMREAADWQLEKVMEWLKDHLDVMSYVWADDVTAWGIDVESVIVDLKQAMRPTTQEDS